MKSLDDVFNIAPTETIVGEIVTKDGEVILPHLSSTDEKIEYDYDKTRDNLHNLLSQGQDALMHALEIAKSSEHPRAFEVVGGLMKQLADVNHQLLDLSEKRQKLLEKSKTDEPSKQVTNNNAIFVGSTTELNKMLQNLTKN
jgi:hypothetical protein